MTLDVRLLRSSFDSALADRPDLAEVFYEELFRRHPRARLLFHGTDMARQQRMLAESLWAVMDHLEDVPWLTSRLAELGRRHTDYGVTAEMYSWVGEALIATLAIANGDDWTPAHTATWAEAFATIAGMMLDGCRDQAVESPVGS